MFETYGVQPILFERKGSAHVCRLGNSLIYKLLLFNNLYCHRIVTL